MTAGLELPLPAAILLVWSAVHAFSATYHGVVYLKLRSSPDFLAVAVTSAGMGAFTVGSFCVASADRLADGIVGQRLQWLALPFVFVGFAALVRSLLSAGRGKWPTRALAAWSVAGAAAMLAGLVLDPSRATSGLYQEAALTPVGGVFCAGSIIIISWLLIALAQRPSADRDAMRFAILNLPTLLAWAWDSAVRVFEWRAPYLVDHAALLTSLGVSYVLMRRFVRASDALRQRTRDLLRSVDERRRVERELIRTEQLATVGELSAVVAVELGYPLDALRHAVSRLRTAGEDDFAERAKLFGALDAQTDRLNRLVRDLLTYARPFDAGHERVDVSELLRQVVDDSRQQAEERAGVDVRLELQGSSRTLFGDASLLRNAFGNVIENAFQAMRRGGTLTVRAEDTVAAGQPALLLLVVDTGDGMHPRVRDRARDPFFTTRPAGTGLGLAIVERIVGAHGGQLELDSDSRGTSVTITLPLDRRSGSLPPRSAGS